MRFLLRAALCLAVLVPLLGTGTPAIAAGCQFVLGFKTLDDRIPETVGECLEDEHHDPLNGNGLQATRNGVLVWRKDTNTTAFTNGFRTWIIGPFGPQVRLNTERFSWEPDRLLPALRDAQFTLPLFSDQETTFRLINGTATLPPPGGTVTLVQDLTAYGDLNGDGVNDAAAILAVDLGGSGTFIWTVAMLDRDRVPVQSARFFLGDRVRVNSVTIINRKISVELLTHGPTDPRCCPTKLVVATLEASELQDPVH
ncbi:MAG TPA: hypothetical protein VFZ25_10640 [Chloroflexota bacterium]|nr:hypothetical protein [Chloroflexota bacterium]